MAERTPQENALAENKKDQTDQCRLVDFGG